MPTYSNNILSVTVAELEKCGVSANYIYRALSGQDKGEVYCWEYHKVGKRVFIHYHSLLQKYQALIKAVLCEGKEPEIYLSDKSNAKNESILTAIEDQLPGLVTADADEIKALSNTGLYSPTKCHQLARTAGWLRVWNEYDVRKVRSLGYKSIVDFREAIFKHCLNEQSMETPLIAWKKGNIGYIDRIKKYANEYKKFGIQSLIHGGVGNVNRERMDGVVHAKLIELASNPVKFSFEDIAMMYNDWAVINDKPEMTTSAIKAYLNTPKIKRIWYYSRHGKLAADNEMQQLIQRKTPSFPDALWSIDGTASQLYYIDEKGKIQSDLYIYFVTDANTGAIVGRSVAFTETSQLVIEALKNAIDTHGNKPFQIQYDGGSANVSQAVQAMMTNMSRVHFPCAPYKGRGKYVEAIIGHFQQRVLRKELAFKGGNINVKSLDSVANPELLEALRKDKTLLYDRAGAIEALYRAVDEWNARGERRDSYGRFIGESKIARYESIQHEKRAKLNYFDRISLFMVEKKIPQKYSTQGIQLEVNKIKYSYIVPDPDDIGDFMFANENLGKKFTIRYNSQNPTMISLYQNGKYVADAYETTRYAACVADMKKGEKARVVKFKSKQDEYGVEYSKCELEIQMAILDGTYKATGTEGFGWWDSDKRTTNIRDSKNEDMRNGMDDGLTDLERKILNIGG